MNYGLPSFMSPAPHHYSTETQYSSRSSINERSYGSPEVLRRGNTSTRPTSDRAPTLGSNIAPQSSQYNSRAKVGQRVHIKIPADLTSRAQEFNDLGLGDTRSKSRWESASVAESKQRSGERNRDCDSSRHQGSTDDRQYGFNDRTEEAMSDISEISRVLGPAHSPRTGASRVEVQGVPADRTSTSLVTAFLENEKKIMLLESKLKDKDYQISKFKTRVKDLTQSNRALHAECDFLKADKDSLTKQVNDLRKNVHDLTQNVHDLRLQVKARPNNLHNSSIQNHAQTSPPATPPFTRAASPASSGNPVPLEDDLRHDIRPLDAQDSDHHVLQKIHAQISQILALMNSTDTAGATCGKTLPKDVPASPHHAPSINSGLPPNEQLVSLLQKIITYLTNSDGQQQPHHTANLPTNTPASSSNYRGPHTNTVPPRFDDNCCQTSYTSTGPANMFDVRMSPADIIAGAKCERDELLALCIRLASKFAAGNVSPNSTSFRSDLEDLSTTARRLIYKNSLYQNVSNNADISSGATVFDTQSELNDLDNEAAWPASN